MTLEALRFHTNISPLVAAVQDRRLLQALLEGAEGKIGGGPGFLVNPNTGKNVRIEACTSGREQLIINGTESPLQGAYALQLDAVDTSITLDAAPGSNSRIDLVLAYVQDAEYSIQPGHSAGTYTPAFAKLTGVASGSPVVPDPAAAGFENFHVLAHVLRTSGEPANLAQSAFTNKVFPCYFGGIVHLGTDEGDGIKDTMRVEWDNDPRIHELLLSGRLDLDGGAGVEASVGFYVNDDQGSSNYSIMRSDAVHGGAMTNWGGSDTAGDIFFRVASLGGGMVGRIVNAQDPADNLIDLRVRSRWNTTTGQRVDFHESLYKPGGPITSVSIEATGQTWSTGSNFRVWGLLESLPLG